VDDTLHVIGGLVATLVVCGQMVWGAARVASRLPESVGGIESLGATLAIPLLMVVMLTTGLGTLGLMDRWIVLPAALLLSAALGLFPGNGPAASVFRQAWNAIREGCRAEPGVLLVMVPGLVAVTLAVGYALDRPPLGYDALNYHLPLAAHYVQAHDLSLFPFPAYYDPYPYFPANGEMFSAWAFLLTGCDLWLPLVNLPFLALLALSVYGLGREAGCNRLAATAVASALATVPAVFNVLTETYVELPLWATFLAALRWSVHAARHPTLSLLFLAAALAGALPGFKQVGWVMAPLVLVFLASRSCMEPRVDGWSRIRETGRQIILFVGGLLVFGTAFYLRNWLVADNPLYPYPVEVQGQQLFPGIDGMDTRAASTSLFNQFGFLWDSGKLFQAFLGQSGLPNSSWGLGPAGVLSVTLCAAAGFLALVWSLVRPGSPSWRFGALLFVLGVLMMLLYALLPRSGSFLFSNVRFAYPGTVLLALAGLAVGNRAGAPPLVITGVFLTCQVAGLLYFTNIPVAGGPALASGGAVLGLGGAGILVRRRWAPEIPNGAKLVTLFGALVLALVAGHWLHGARYDRHVREYEAAPESWQFDYRAYAPCVHALGKALPEGRLALAASRNLNGFVSPLFGTHLEREIRVVDATSPWDAGRWATRVADSGATALMVFMPEPGDGEPRESAFARSLPRQFRPLHRSERCELYRVTWEDQQ